MDMVGFALLDAKREAMAANKKDSAQSGGSGSVSLGGSGSMGGSRPASIPCSLSDCGSGIGTRSASTFAPPASGSGGTPSALPSAVVHTLTDDARSAVQHMMDKVIAKSGQELADMQLSLEQARSDASTQRDAMIHMEIEVAELRARLGMNDGLSEALSASRKKMLSANEERDDLRDKIVGMEARAKSKSDRHEKEVADMKLEFSKREAAADTKNKADRKAMADELRAAAKSLEKLREEQNTMIADREMTRRAEVLSQKNNDDELSFVRAELNAARREADRREMEDLGTMQTRADDFAEQRILEAKLKESHLQNLAMNQSLKDLRLEMLQMHTDNQEQMAFLRAQKSDASPLGMNANASRRRKQMQSAAAKRLPGIDEDDPDEIGSTTGSCISAQVSACEDGVGDLSEFEDKEEGPREQSVAADAGPSKVVLNEQIARLHEELSVAETAHKYLEDSSAAVEAEHLSKLGRLGAQLLASRDEANASGVELDRMIKATAENDAVRAGELLLMAHRLQNMQLMQDRNEADMPRIREMEERRPSTPWPLRSSPSACWR